MALITLAQLEARVDVPDPARAQAFIDDASALVELIAKPVVIDPLSVPPALVPIVTNMVNRAINNPRGLTGEMLGDYQWTAFGGTAAAIYATRDEVRMIRRAVGRLGVGTVLLKSEYATKTTTDSILGS